MTIVLMAVANPAPLSRICAAGIDARDRIG